MGNSPSALETCLSNVFVNAAGSNHVSFPSNPFYQLTAVRPYNLDIPITPAAVTRPSTAGEVSEIIKCAIASEVKVQPRSGGHSYGNYGIGGEDGAVVVDLVNFQNFEMDTNTWFATFGSGTLLGDLTTRLHENGGRAIAHGTCPQVGTGGHLTIGGLGPTSRLWGAALDHIEEVEVVLANGTITRASDTLNPDVFFALKGAAASFGIITEFVVHTQPELTQAVRYTYDLLLGDHGDMATTFANWQDLIKDPQLDRRFASQVIVHPLGMLVTGTFFGTKAEYDATGYEKRLARNASVTVIEMSDWLGIIANWAETEALKIVGGIPGPFYSKSLTFTKDTLIPFNGIQALFDYFENAKKGTLIWFAIFDLEAGAINDVPKDATAYGHRDALFYIQTYAIGIPSLSDTTTAYINGINNVITTAMPGVDFGAYAGYVDPALPNGQQAYWNTNLPKLTRIKNEIDPNDVFHNPQSVRTT